MPKLQIPEKLLPLFEESKRFKVVYGGRGGGKSISIGDLLLMFAQTRGEKIGCFREIQKSMDDSVHSLLESEIARLRLDGFTVMHNKIIHESGGEFTYDGLSRNPDSVKSKHGYSKFWIEEAQTISETSLQMLTPTLRVVRSMYEDDEDDEDREIWFSLNPRSAEDPIAKRFIVPYLDALNRDGYYEDDLHLIIKVNYTDNPFFEGSGLDLERQWDYENKPRAEYDHIWLGEFNDAVDDSIIPAEWFDSAIDAHLKLGFGPRGVKVVSHDPSDLGPDSKGLAIRHGSVVLSIEEKLTGDVNDGIDWACDKAIGASADIFVYDAGGMGAGCRSQVNQNLNGKGVRVEAFNGAESPRDPDSIYQGRDEYADESKPKTKREVFKNLRADAYWGLRDRFYLTYRAVELGEYADPDDMISLSSEIGCMQQLRSEVCRIPRKPNGAGMIQIMTKDEMRSKHKIKSPNLADSLAMAFVARPKKKRGPTHINIDFAQRA